MVRTNSTMTVGSSSTNGGGAERERGATVSPPTVCCPSADSRVTCTNRSFPPFIEGDGRSRYLERPSLNRYCLRAVSPTDEDVGKLGVERRHRVLRLGLTDHHLGERRGDDVVHLRPDGDARPTERGLQGFDHHRVLDVLLLKLGIGQGRTACPWSR